MNCDAIRPSIRSFLDDLMDEKDYQNIQTHLAGCAKCAAYASSVGTLFYRLHELGQVSVPPDIASTVFHELKKNKMPMVGEEVSPEQAPSRMNVPAVLALAVLLAGLTVAGLFWWGGRAATSRSTGTGEVSSPDIERSLLALEKIKGLVPAQDGDIPTAQTVEEIRAVLDELKLEPPEG